MTIKEADMIANLLGKMLQVKGIVGYKIARNLRMINEELKEYNQIKQELFQKYGTEINGQLVINKLDDNYAKFMDEIKPYEEQEVNFDFKKITDEELQNGDLTAEQVLILSEYFSEE